MPFMVLSLLLIYKGKENAAATAMLTAYHIGCFVGSFMCDSSIGILIGVNLMPAIGSLITSSSLVQSINLLLCVVQNIASIFRVNLVFGVLQTQEQEREIMSMQIFASCSLATHWVHSYLNRHIETELCNELEVLHGKVANITQELAQVLCTQDKMVAQLNSEVMSSLNFLNRGVDYLSTTIRNASCTETLKKAKLNVEKISKIISNVLSAVKLRSESMILDIHETDLVNTMKEMLTINTETLKKNQVFIKAFIYKNVPSLVRLDSNKFLQVLMNITSNAINFTRKNGEVKIYMKWYAHKTSPAILKRPIEVNPFEMTTQTKKIFSIGNSIQHHTDSNSDVVDDISRELDPSEVTNHQDKFDSLRGFNIKTLQHLASKEKEMEDHLVPWTIINKDISSTQNSQANDTLSSEESWLQTLHASKGYITIQVSDNGCGISNQVISKLLDMFDSNMNERHEITGFGIWISKYLCDKMNGDIAVYSKKGQGTTLVFYIPVKVGAAVENPKRSLNSARQIRVLVVDDDVFIRNLHKTILEQEGVQVSLAPNGIAGVHEYIKRSNGYFDFIMMDVQMPEMDGFTAAGKIREFEEENEWSHVDILIVSGEFYDESEVWRKLKAQVGLFNTSQMKCLKKPIDSSAVRDIVNGFKKKKEAISRSSTLNS